MEKSHKHAENQPTKPTIEQGRNLEPFSDSEGFQARIERTVSPETKNRTVLINNLDSTEWTPENSDIFDYCEDAFEEIFNSKPEQLSFETFRFASLEEKKATIEDLKKNIEFAKEKPEKEKKSVEVLSPLERIKFTLDKFLDDLSNNQIEKFDANNFPENLGILGSLHASGKSTLRYTIQSALKADDTGNFFSANGSEENPLYQEEIKLTEEQKTNFIALLEKQITSLTKKLEQMQNPETVLRITEIIQDWKQEINILHE